MFTFLLLLRIHITPLMDISNILQGNHDAIIADLLTYDKPEALATYFSNMRTILISEVATSKEVPKNLVQLHYVLTTMEAFFLAVAIAEKNTVHIK